MKLGDRVKYTPCCFAAKVSAPNAHAGTVREAHSLIGYTYYDIVWDDGAQSWCHERDLTLIPGGQKHGEAT